MAEENADSALAALRDVLGSSVDDDQLRKLMNKAGNDVGAALNLHYDQQLASADSTPKRAAPSVPSFFDQRKRQKLESEEPATVEFTQAGSRSKSEKSASGADVHPGKSTASSAPLAERMRPKHIEELLGQEDALGSILRQALQEDHLPSLILWGPPGCGKTSFASCVAAATKRTFRSLSAAKAGVAELRDLLVVSRE